MPGSFCKPADYPLIEDYARAVDMSRILASMIGEAADADELGRLLVLRDREVKRACALACTLRLAPQSRYDHKAAGVQRKRASGARPWDAPNADDAA